MSFRTENQAKSLFRNTGNRKGLDEKNRVSLNKQELRIEHDLSG